MAWRRGLLLTLSTLALLALAAAGSSVWRRSPGHPEVPSASRPGHLVLATATTLVDSGLLPELVRSFTSRTGVEVRAIAVGTGQALAIARRGDADLVLTHSPELEEAFMAEGFGTERRCVAYNRFIVAGPADDPAGVRQARSAPDAFARIARRRAPFISRADGSGTHFRERAIWQKAGIDPSGAPWYLPSGAGMATAFTMADEKQAYVLGDLPTFLMLQGRLRLRVLYGDEPDEPDPDLFNQYAAITLNPARFPHRQHAAARAFVEYLLSDEGQTAIGNFGVERFGASLFTPLGGRCIR